MRHPGARATEFSKYLSYNGKEIMLGPNSCICDACRRDCLRGEGKPRWYNIHAKHTEQTLHALL